MPVVFNENWNRLNLAALNSSDTISLFWLAKMRIKRDAPAQKAKLVALSVKADAKTLTSLEQAEINRLPGAVKGKFVDSLEQEITVLDNGIAGGKVSLPMVKRFGGIGHPSFNQPKLKLDEFLEKAIHNDRLRISDKDMLGRYPKNLL